LPSLRISNNQATWFTLYFLLLVVFVGLARTWIKPADRGRAMA
jgi:hypothetical protein